jgi:protease-4
MAANNKLGCLSIFLFVALCASLFMNFVLALGAFQRLADGGGEVEMRPRFREVILERGVDRSANKIAVISLRGIISTGVRGAVGESMVDDLRWQFEQARKDENVRAVVLEVDSPGGEVTASDMIYHAVAKTRAQKPVVVYMESLAASGGYYVSCGGEISDGERDEHHRQHRRHYSNPELPAALRQNRARGGGFQKWKIQGYAKRSAADHA